MLRLGSLVSALLSTLLSAATAASDPPGSPDPILPEEAAAIRRHFGIDQPWDNLATAPEQVRRHRGFVALLIAGTETAAPLEPLPLPPPARSDVILRSIFQGRDLLAEKRDEFGWAYYSPTDGSGQPLVLRIPHDYDPRKSYPLIVILHGLGQRPRPDPNLTAREPVILAWPWGRGDTAYRGLGGQDVWDAMEAIQSWYSIDPRRISLMGFSMGGHGAWSLAAHRPNLFAAVAPVSGWPQPDFLVNLRQVPLFVRHGSADVTVPTIFSRYAYAVLARNYSPINFQELPGAGHGLGSPVFNQVQKWILSQPPSGGKILHFKLENPTDLQLSGLSGIAFEQPHQPAWIHIEPASTGFPAPRITSENLLKIRLNSSSSAFLFDGQPLGSTSAVPQIWVRQDAHWMADHTVSVSPRDYRAGAAANLFDGEPLLIVIPSAGPPAQNQKLAAYAKTLARFAGDGKPMVTGGISIRTDRELSAAEREHCNLILIGSPRYHAEIRRLLPLLPLRLSNRDEWLTGETPPLSRSENGLLCFHFNPLQPSRWIYLIIPPSQPALADRWLRNPAHLLAGADGLNRLGQPDLIITSPDQGDRLWRQFDRDWSWRNLPANTNRLAATHTVQDWALCRAADALFKSNQADGLLLGTSEKVEVRRIDPDYFTEASAAAGQPDIRLSRVRIPRRTLDKILAKARGFRLYPAPSSSGSPESESFRLLVPFDLLWTAAGVLPELPKDFTLEPIEMP
jgi:hypothetical protein